MFLFDWIYLRKTDDDILLQSITFVNDSYTITASLLLFPPNINSFCDSGRFLSTWNNVSF